MCTTRRGTSLPSWDACQPGLQTGASCLGHEAPTHAAFAVRLLRCCLACMHHADGCSCSRQAWQLRMRTICRIMLKAGQGALVLQGSQAVANRQLAWSDLCLAGALLQLVRSPEKPALQALTGGRMLAPAWPRLAQHQSRAAHHCSRPSYQAPCQHCCTVLNLESTLHTSAPETACAARDGSQWWNLTD